MDLKCRQLKCKFNNCYSCESESIKVTKNYQCSTFDEAKKIDEKQKQDVSKTMFEAAPELHPYRHNLDVNIKCNAHCLYNNKTDCVANGICINECEKDATCITFSPK